jgi:RNA methyltransferase, TrmH family
MTKSIASRQNAWFKRLRDAVRDHDAEIVLEGPKMVSDAIEAGWKPVVVVHRSPIADRRHTDPTIEMSPELFDAIADTRTAQGVLALFERPKPADVFARKDTLTVVLDAVQDPGNVGTIIRLAAAFDAGGVGLLAGCADPFSPKAIRASAGAVLQVPIASIELSDLNGRALYAATGEGKAIEPPAKGATLVFGSEGRGVSDALLANAKQIAIATSGRVESLNVATAAAILLSRSFALRRR